MEIHRQKGTLDQMLEQGIQEGRFSFETLQQHARKYRARGEWEKAAAAYKGAINITTSDWQKKNIATKLIGIYAQLGQTEAAIELYETLARTSLPDSIAIKTIKTSSGFGTRIYFGNDETRQNLIKAYQDKGKLDDLLALMAQRLETNGDTPDTHEIIADIHRARGDYAKAAESDRKLCNAQPSNVRSFYAAAAAFNKSGKAGTRTNDVEQRQSRPTCQQSVESRYVGGCLRSQKSAFKVNCTIRRFSWLKPQPRLPKNL